MWIERRRERSDAPHANEVRLVRLRSVNYCELRRDESNEGACLRAKRFGAAGRVGEPAGAEPLGLIEVLIFNKGVRGQRARHAPAFWEVAMLSLVFASLTLSLNVLQSPPASRPDLSGSWTMERSRSQSAESATLEIKQRPGEIVLVTHRAGKTSERTYPLETSSHSASETISAGHNHASWDGAKLVIETVAEISGQTVSYRQMLFLNAAGTEMTVETITIVQHANTTKGGKNFSGATDVYVRK